MESTPLVLTKHDAAELLQVSEDTVENLHRCGELRAIKIGKHLRWRLADVEKFVLELQPAEANGAGGNG